MATYPDFHQSLTAPHDGNAFREFLERSGHPFAQRKLKKNEFLVREGDICNVFCYIESGILEHSVVVNGEYRTTYLAMQQSVTSSLNSFLAQTHSRKSIRAITDAVILACDKPAFDDLMAHNPEFYRLYHSIIEKQICLIDDFRIDLLTLTPEERYRKLLATEPKLLLEIPLHYLAAFLGISARHMSRIRKNGK
jgi:CRP-like cAMP-binding protein